MFKTLWEWERRRKERLLARWPEKRKNGRSYYVSGAAMKFCLIMTAVMTSGDLILGNPTNLIKVMFTFVLMFVGGCVAGLIEWNRTEKEFLKLSLSTTSEK